MGTGVRASRLKARAAKPRNLSGSPKSHMVGRNNSFKLSSNFYKHAVVHTGHTCTQDRQTDRQSDNMGGPKREEERKKSKWGQGVRRKAHESEAEALGSSTAMPYCSTRDTQVTCSSSIVEKAEAMDTWTLVGSPWVWEVPALLKSVMKVQSESSLSGPASVHS